MTDPIAIQLDLDISLDNVRRRGQEIGNILERSLNRNTRLQALNHLERQIEQVRNKVRDIQHELQNTLDTPIRTREYAKIDDAFQQARRTLKDLIDDYAKLNNVTQYQAEQALRANRNPLPLTGGVKSAEDIQKIIDAYDKLNKARNDLGNRGEAFTVDEEAVKRLRGQLDVTTNSLHEMMLRYQELANNSGNSIQNGLQPIINFNQELSQNMAAFSQAFGPYVQIATTAMQALVEVTKAEIKVLSKMGQAAITAFKPLVSLAQMAGSAIKKMFDNIKKHNETTMKNLWRNILRYGIGVRSFYFLARKIRAAIGDVINELAKQIPEVNAQMSAFQTAVNGLKGSLATAFQPILTAVLPILTKLINMVSRAIAVIGQFFALLTGQKFVYAATATQVDYAASLDKTGKSAKKAKKELEGYLSPIDEINKYQTKNKDDSGSGDGGGDYTLKKVPIDDWMKDFFDRIKKAWQNANFFELGKMLGDKLAKALASIPWNKIKNEARRLGKSLATLLNGIMSGEFDGKSLGYWIGRTFAEAINTAFEFLDQFVKNFDWKKLGQTIVDAIKGVFENLDWNVITETLGELGLGIGQTIAKIFEDPKIFTEMGDALGRFVNAVVDMIYNFFNQQSGEDIGNAIASFINSAVEQFDAKDFANTCNVILETLLDSLISTADTIEWDKIGEKLAQLISSIDFKGIFSKYASLASSIINAILDLLESFLDTLSSDKIEEIGTSIADAINNIDIQPKRLGTVANKLIQALLDIALEAVTQVDWGKIAEDIGDILERIDWVAIFGKLSVMRTQMETGLLSILNSAINAVAGQILRSVLDLGINIMNGVIQGLSYANPIAKILAIFNNIVKAIKDFLGIHSPSTVFSEIGTNIVQGFINGIQSIVAKASQVWNSLKTTTVNIFNGIWNSIKGVINSILGGVERMANGIIEGFNKAISAMNNLQFDVPGWVPIVGGNHLGFNIPTLDTISIPKLAQGAVIPPNKEFLAMLGDQKSGTNIETPLETMVEAFNTALRQNGGNSVQTINFLLPDRRTLAQYTIQGGRIIQTSTGKNPFELA